MFSGAEQFLYMVEINIGLEFLIIRVRFAIRFFRYPKSHFPKLLWKIPGFPIVRVFGIFKQGLIFRFIFCIFFHFWIFFKFLGFFREFPRNPGIRYPMGHVTISPCDYFYMRWKIPQQANSDLNWEPLVHRWSFSIKTISLIGIVFPVFVSYKAWAWKGLQILSTISPQYLTEYNECNVNEKCKGLGLVIP